LEKSLTLGCNEGERKANVEKIDRHIAGRVERIDRVGLQRTRMQRLKQVEVVKKGYDPLNDILSIDKTAYSTYRYEQREDRGDCARGGGRLNCRKLVS
jgi:hypothetical protein